jgi:hypothetical protein
MNIKLFRLLSLVLLARILFTSHNMLLAYWAALIFSVGYLNTRQEFVANIRLYNALFFIYLLFIVALRTTGTSKNQSIVYVVNVFEHLVFAFIISFKISLYLTLFKATNTLKEIARYCLCAVLFNIVGFMNEIYQNLAKGLPPFKFSYGSKIDMLVNVVGSVLFVATAYVYNNRYKHRAVQSPCQ